MEKYKLPSDFSFSIDLPKEIKAMLSDTILETELGIALKSNNRLYKAATQDENQSSIENDENHFHVDWYLESHEHKKAFMLGIKTLVLLADKFQKEQVVGVRFWYSFQTPELSKIWAKENKITAADEDHNLSDRLSFYKRRKGEDILPIDLIESKYWAILILDC
ncbi:MAG: hypothetical protein ACRCYO_07000 [Bacteroidia bacterium]